MTLIRTMAAVCCLLASTASQADETLSERVGGMLQAQTSKQLNSDLSFSRFELITLTGELLIDDFALATRVEELDAGLNQVLRADTLVLAGDWLGPQQQNLVVDKLEAQGAQLTLAYYAEGQSNVHHLIDALRRTQGRYQTAEQLLWQVDKVVLNDVVVNLFDRGLPLVSARIATLELPPVRSDENANDYIAKLLPPILDQIQQQIRAGDVEAVVDTPRLFRLLWREAIVQF